MQPVFFARMSDRLPLHESRQRAGSRGCGDVDPTMNSEQPRIRTEVQVMFFDTDCGGVVSNIAYLRFIEIARTLPPPPLRHALLVSLIALAALLRLTTLGWGDLYNHTEGQYAGAAREMIQSHQWIWPTNDGLPRLPKPPLLYWLIIGSFKIFGINSAAARLPIALAAMAVVAITFLIAEKLGDYWRGFFAGLIYLCSCGTALLGRVIMPEPVFSAFIAGAIFCGVSGYQRRRGRNLWFLGFWICCVLACLTKSLLGLIYPLTIFIFLGLFYREARLRFRRLLHWGYISIFVVLFAPWYIATELRFPGFLQQLLRIEWLGHLRSFSNVPGSDNGVPPLQFIWMHLVWWFPL